MAFLIVMLACTYNPNDLPLVDKVPIVASDRCAAPREVFVACVLDGDTFDIGSCGESGERIRMLGIDAPEIAHPPDPAECWGNNAATELRRQIEGTTVLLTFDRRCQGVFGRTLAYVWDSAEDSVSSINLQLVADGHARVFDEEFGEIIFQRDYEQTQDVASNRGVGLWGACP